MCSGQPVFSQTGSVRLMATRDDWIREYRSLDVTATRLVDGLRHKLQALDVPVDVLTSADCASVAEARRELLAAVATAQSRVHALRATVETAPPLPSAVASLAAEITAVSDLLAALKADQRAAYAKLLQDEQELMQQLESSEAAVETAAESTPAACLLNASAGGIASGRASHMLGGVGAAAEGKGGCTPLGSGASCATAAAPHVNHTARSASSAHMRAPYRGISHGTGAAAAAAAVAAGSAAGSAHATRGGLLPEVAAYDAFVTQHGACGGWHPDDHATFASLLRQGRGDYAAVLSAAADALPALSRQQVLAHCRWHADLVDLDMRRRIALVSWRAERDAAKAVAKAEAASVSDAFSQQAAQDAPDQQQKQTREQQRRRVAAWQERRADAQAAAAACAAAAARERAAAERAALDARRGMLRGVLREARERTAAEAAAAAAAAASTEKLHAQTAARQAAATAAACERARERAAAALERRRGLLEAKEGRAAARARAQTAMLAAMADAAPAVDRDPRRLLSATAAVAARAAEAAVAREGAAAASSTSRGRITSGFVLHLGGKAVPAWASGMR